MSTAALFACDAARSDGPWSRADGGALDADAGSNGTYVRAEW